MPSPVDDYVFILDPIDGYPIEPYPELLLTFFL